MKHKLLVFGVFFIPIVCFAQSKVIFTHDNAGNQVVFNYCGSGDCQSLQDDEIIQVQDKVPDSVAAFDENRISIYPNPTKDHLIISWDKAPAEYVNKILFFDVLGKSSEIYIERQQVKLEMSHLPHGIYLLKIYLQDLTILTKKIIKN